MEDAYEAEVEHVDAMEDNKLCRDLTAKFASKFIKGHEQKSEFLDIHQASCGMISLTLSV